jgi:signal transduction histidine kinase
MRGPERRPFDAPLPAADDPAPAADSVPTILVAGLVLHLERLQDLGYIQRARLRLVLPTALRGVDLVVVGTPASGIDTAGVVADLRREPATSATPILHSVADGATCGRCGADVCLPHGAGGETLLGVARALLELRRTRQELRRERAATRRETPGSDSAEPAGASTRAARLEALGRLARGIAHDFNNLLGVVTGQVEFVRRLKPTGDPAAARLAQAVEAAERAAGLSRQLLAFTREPVGRPQPLDLNAVVAPLEPILERAVGETVRLEVRPGHALGTIRADPTRIEQVLLNLAFNARDAMPAGGRLTIETHNVDLPDGDLRPPPILPGRYVMLSVSDDGVGMEPRTLARIFEAHFTTKAEGRGSGLGLATVHGIVTQAGGGIRVDSEPGLGTTFRIYLPRLDEPRSDAPFAPGTCDVPGGTETVLLAEDSAAVREVTQSLLEALGYRVVAVANGVEALRAARDHAGPIHLLLADLVMPRLGGASLADQLVELRPETRVLFMSGYGDDGGVGGGRGEPEVLRKPFTEERLARAVRHAIDARPLLGEL